MDADLYRAAEETAGFMPRAEGLALYQAARDSSGPVVEIGSYQGKSTIFLAAGARENKRPVVTIDHHRGSEEHQPGWEYHDASLVDRATGRLDTLPKLRQTLARAGLEDDVIVIVGQSARVAELWHGPIGLLFIDGGHTDAAAQQDYESWAPKATALAIHDVFPDPADGGQAPYRIYLRALADGFTETRQEGSLRILARP